MAEYQYMQDSRTVAADVSSIITFAPPSGETWKLLSLTYVPRATSAANDTNYVSIRPYKDSGTPTALAAARVTTVAGGALTAKLPENITLTAVGTDLEITQADCLYIEIDSATNGTGVAVDLMVLARFEVLRS